MSHRLSKTELDEQFEQFLKESVSDESLDMGSSEKQPRAKSRQKSAPKPAPRWWQEDDDGDESGVGKGLSGSGKSFRKSLRKSYSIQEEDEDPGGAAVKTDSVVFRKDDTETESGDSLQVPDMSRNPVGMDTLEEEEEKARFFAQIEAEASSTLDYSKLNEQLDSTRSPLILDLRKAEEAVDQNDDGQSKARVTETVRTSSGSLHYSEDFEEEVAKEEDSVEDPVEERPEIPPNIAKVALYDSLDDTGGESGRKDTAESLDKRHTYVKSGASEMEALHEAYRQIHVVEASDDYFPNQHHDSAKGDGRLHISGSSSHRPHGQSLQHVSTHESDLPTAEELMRPIRIEDDHTRGFSLQPVSAIQPAQEKTPHSLERTFPVMYHTELPLGSEEAATKVKGCDEMIIHRNSSPDNPSYDLTWSIREKVATLMDDYNKVTSNKSSQASRVNKQPASRYSMTSRTSTSSVKKPTVSPVRGRKVEERKAGPRSSGVSRPAAAATAAAAATGDKIRSPQRLSRTFAKSPERDDDTEAGVRVSSELVASVQSLVSVLQQQINTGSQRDSCLTHHLTNHNRDESSPLVEELRMELAQKERELQKLKEGADELNSLRQENYILQSKLRGTEEAIQKKRRAEPSDPATEETLQKLEKELQEQETLIRGYQQENEKIYLQLKAQQAKIKASEEAMFNENHILQNELTFTREQLNRNSRPVGNVCLMNHSQRITDLLAKINNFQRNEAKLSEDIRRLKQEKQALDVDLQLMRKERDFAQAQVTSNSGDKSFEMRVMEEKHREEMSGLQRKLNWFSENQELLDRDADRLRAATTQISQLTEQVEKLKVELGKRTLEQQRKAKDKTVGMKKMEDLQRQVKELEQILKNRNPNSLPALIYAASSASAQEDEDSGNTSSPNRIVTLLEARICRLEAELENRDEEAKRSQRAMEQRFHSVKLRYEQQISHLEQQLEQKLQIEDPSPATVNQPGIDPVQSLEKDLQQEKERHQEKEKSLQEEIESLQQQLKCRAVPTPTRHQRQAEEAFGIRLERLSNELSTKTRTNLELSRTVERLQKERRDMLSLPSPRGETRSPATRRQPGPAKVLCSVSVRSSRGEEETFPAAYDDKTYQPSAFAGSHISEVERENQALTERLKMLELQAEQEKEALKASVTQAKEESRRIQQHCAEELSTMEARYLRMLDQLRAKHAFEHSSSKVAQQANQLSAQEVQIKHLQEQLKALQGTKEALTVSRTREDALQSQLTKLLQELREAKDAQSLEVKHLCRVERKIINMELKHQQRETELQQVIGGSWPQQAEVEHWRNLAQEKKKELEAFRVELDSILDLLKHLQGQGLVFPPP